MYIQTTILIIEASVQLAHPLDQVTVNIKNCQATFNLKSFDSTFTDEKFTSPENLSIQENYFMMKLYHQVLMKKKSNIILCCEINHNVSDGAAVRLLRRKYVCS